MKRIILGLLAASSVFCASSALAQTQPATRAGWVDIGNGTRNAVSATANIVTGVEGVADWRSFISFSVPASANAYTTAEIRLNASTVQGGPNTLEVFDVTTDVVSDPIATVYADLGSGTSYGTATNLSTGNAVSLVLNAQGLAAVNAARGSTITFGMANATIGGNPDEIFGFSTNSTPRSLVLTAPTAVPTLSEWAMILMGLLLAGGATAFVQRRRFTA